MDKEAVGRRPHPALSTGARGGFSGRAAESLWQLTRRHQAAWQSEGLAQLVAGAPPQREGSAAPSGVPLTSGPLTERSEVSVRGLPYEAELLVVSRERRESLKACHQWT